MSVRRRLTARLTATAIAAAIGGGFTTIPAASALAQPAPVPARPASAAQPVKPAPSHPAAPLAPLTMTQVVADLMDVLNNHPEAFTPLFNVPARRLFGSLGYVTAVNPTHHTVTV
jgi:hypothetical protein